MMYVRVVQDNVKFDNVDVVKFIEKIGSKYVQYYQSKFGDYQSEFDIDKKILRDAIGKQEQERTFVWLCYTRGTWLFYERDVFIKDTWEHNTVELYAEKADEYTYAFIIEVTGIDNGEVIGNVYAFNYDAFYMNVQNRALDAAYVMAQYEHGVRIKDANTVIVGYPDEEYGKFQFLQYLPYSEQELIELLHREKQEREHFPEGNTSTYIASL